MHEELVQLCLQRYVCNHFFLWVFAVILSFSLLSFCMLCMSKTSSLSLFLSRSLFNLHINVEIRHIYIHTFTLFVFGSFSFLLITYSYSFCFITLSRSFCRYELFPLFLTSLSVFIYHFFIRVGKCVVRQMWKLSQIWNIAMYGQWKHLKEIIL